ncbi:PhzF family phenazine biosynthesis protein [Nocardioides litoris]|uniref:PhzF family phenazine biosynthesis protein n=1 Tax=Nocardioides litoris TaxID=1926648 RepID=UPI0011242F15|nr:PhzF family phenazine biosynthesis protein [Nocardioides litoris]
MRSFRQVDVFSTEPLLGNPVAVVHDADGLDDDQMAAFARWTNLSETTFLLRPTQPGADYRLRIFTTGGELPFAGHPTLGSAHAWLEAGGEPAAADAIVQECGAGLVTVRRDTDGAGGRLAFAAPPLRRSGPADEADVAAAVRGLGLRRDDVVDAAWVDNGPGWLGLLLPDAETVLRCGRGEGFADLKVGVVGPRPAGDECAVEVRAVYDGFEDPVTGSLNAGLAQWLAGRVLPPSYVAAQGTALQRRGRVHVDVVDGTVWVGGATRTTITGSVDLAGVP